MTNDLRFLGVGKTQGCPVCGKKPALGINQACELIVMIENRMQLSFVVPQRFFRQLLLGNVSQYTRDTKNVAVGVTGDVVGPGVVSVAVFGEETKGCVAIPGCPPVDACRTR